MQLKTVGYQVLVELDEKAKEVVNEDGLIIAAGSDSHQLMSGVVFEIGSLALKEDPEISIGDRIYFIERDCGVYRVKNKRFGIVETRNVKIVEKEN